MEIGKRVPGIEPGFCRLRDLRLYRSLHEEVSQDGQIELANSFVQVTNVLIEILPCL